jgi:hypothetical protein
MPKILVNYRRDDSAAYAGRLADRLREHFGDDNVFVDIDTIQPGDDYVEKIDQSIAACDVVVVIIGRSWLSATDAQGRRRLDRDDDFVRMEIMKALQRRIRVIPVLVGDAAMPEAANLPPDLAGLSRRQGIEISDSRFHQDVDRLIEALSDGSRESPKQHSRSANETGRSTPSAVLPSRWILGAVGVVILAVIAYWSVVSRDPVSDGDRQAPAAASNPTVPTNAPVSGSPASASGQPGAQIPPPPVTPAPAGTTGIQMVWRGADAMPCFLYDETGTKPLSPANPVLAWRCAKDMGLWDAAPGKYQIKFGDGVAIIAPLNVVVNRGAVTRVEPPVGQLRLHWNGTNAVAWYLLDKTGEKTLSIANPVLAWRCDAGQTCVKDVGAGDYLVRVDAAGYEPVKVTIAPFRVTDVTIP